MKKPVFLPTHSGILPEIKIWPHCFLAFCLLILGCGGQQRRQPPLRQEDPYDVRNIYWEITDYRDKDKNGIIPVWVDLYFRENISSIENLEEFADHYVFISANSGINFNALKQWNAAFAPDLDFARLAAARIEKRFLNAAITYPDDEYGSFYEALIRAASDAQWTGAEKRGDFWVYRVFYEAVETEETEAGTENYDFLILVIIEKNLLERQIQVLLNNINPDEPLSRDQRNAVNRVTERFFEGF